MYIPSLATSYAKRPKPAPGTRTLKVRLKKIVVRCKILFDKGRRKTLLQAKPRQNIQSARPSLACKITRALLFPTKQKPVMKNLRWKKRIKTSSLQSRTNCLRVLLSLSMSNSDGLYFVRSDFVDNPP